MTGKVKVFGAGPDGDGFVGHMTSGFALLLSCHSSDNCCEGTSIIMTVIKSLFVHC